MASLLDGVLIEFAIASPAESRKKAGKDALLIGWECDDRTHLWLEAARLAQKGWHIDVPQNRLIRRVLNCSRDKKSSSGRGNPQRLDSRNSSTTGVNRGLLSHFIIKCKRP